MDLFSVLDEPPAQRHSETSVAAARAIKPDANRYRAMVLAALRRAGADGLTDEEGIAATGIGPSTYRPRRGELVDRGFVQDGGGKRPTASGRPAVVWIAVDRVGT